MQDYAAGAFDPDIVEVRLGFPDLTQISRQLPLAKTVVHLDLDDSSPELVGFGQPGTSTYDVLTGMVTEKIADAKYVLNFDVGIWASEESGGGTSRMEVHQALNRLFVGSVADVEMASATNGLHLRLPGLSGGRYILDPINDVPLWRAIDMTLPIQIYARRAPLPSPAIETLDIEIETFVSP